MFAFEIRGLTVANGAHFRRGLVRVLGHSFPEMCADMMLRNKTDIQREQSVLLSPSIRRHLLSLRFNAIRSKSSSEKKAPLQR